MDIYSIFQLANLLALSGWIALLLAPVLPRLADTVAARLIPLLLAIVYAALMMTYWSSAEGGFDTLEGVMQLFTQAPLVLAGWLHYLAFDLFVGAWEVRTAREERIHFALVIPCLILTFMFGPVGYFVFMALRMIHRQMYAVTPT